MLASKTSWDALVTITSEARADLEWWRTAINGCKGAPLGHKVIQAQITTEASSFGWGGVYENKEAV